MARVVLVVFTVVVLAVAFAVVVLTGLR